MFNTAVPSEPGKSSRGLPPRLVGPGRLDDLMREIHFHEGDGGFHFHEIGEAEKAALADFIWRADNVELTTVGIDIGSSTSHLMFAKVHLQRKAQMLSSSYVVVDRTVLWKSPIMLTPFLPDNTIDAGKLKDFIDSAYEASGLERDAIDSGAVILTGEAIKRTNAHAIARLFAEESGKFVCASAGHHLECTLAAHGSGAVALSRRTHRTILNVDIGGGTTKFALIQNGVIRATYAVAVGGRLLVHDQHGTLVRVDESAQQAAESLGMHLSLGMKPDPAQIERIVDTLAETLVGLICDEQPSGLAKALLLTDMPSERVKPHWVTFSGGVSEYLFSREPQTYGDIAKPLADKVARAFKDKRIPAALIEPGNGIRATVIGASQFTVQLSGKTIHISKDAALPLHNVPVVFPSLKHVEDFSIQAVASELAAALKRIDVDAAQPVAIAIRWQGEPHYARLRSLAEGLAKALDGASALPAIFMIDGDVGRTLGLILEQELKLRRPVIAIDGVQLQELDYVDIGKIVEPANVVPIVIKSLLFSAGR